MSNNTNSPYVNAPQSSLYNSGMTDHRSYGDIGSILKQRAADPYANQAMGLAAMPPQPAVALNAPWKSLADKQSFINGGANQEGALSKFLGDENKMGNISSLASTLMQAASLPSMLKSAKLQNQTAQHNLDVGRTEQARRNKNISGFNAV